MTFKTKTNQKGKGEEVLQGRERGWLRPVQPWLPSASTLKLLPSYLPLPRSLQPKKRAQGKE
eukprot:12088845-Prorocentrum_lima.AAC.1